MRATTPAGAPAGDGRDDGTVAARARSRARASTPGRPKRGWGHRATAATGERGGGGDGRRGRDAFADGAHARGRVGEGVETRRVYKTLAVALVALGAPALLNSVNEPVVSLVETVLVSRVGTLFLAALAPASAMFGLVEEVCFAFSVAVTTALSALSVEREALGGGARAKLELAPPTEETTHLVTASVCAAFVGWLALALALQALYGPICKIMLVPNEVEALLRMYTVFRCVGLPMFAAANALEGAFLGRKDALTTMWVWLASGVITAGLQVLYITPGMGATSAVLFAGIALTTGQAYSFAMFSIIARRRGFIALRSVFEVAETFSQSAKRAFKKLVDAEIISEVAWLVLNATAKMTTYMILTTFATQFGVVPAAVNKTLLDIYILLGLCAEPVFTVGNVLLPRKRDNPEDVAITRRALFSIALFMGFTLGVAAYIACGSAVLFDDPRSLEMAKNLRVVVAVTIGFSTAAYATDGCVIGTGDAKFVGTAQLVNIAIFIAGFIFLQRYYGAAMSLQHVWSALLAFQALRLVEHAWKIREDEHALGLAIRG